MAKQPKPCEYCQTVVTLRYRIQFDQSEHWYLVCPDCWSKLSANNPYYRYGGTWKAK